MIHFTCDQCGDDITTAPPRQRLCLYAEALRPAPEAPYDGSLYVPLVEGLKHFCGFACLSDWTEKYGD